jgi:uncharacterized membrane protein
MVLVLIVAVSCKKNDTNNCNANYTETIQPIIQQKCATAGCHNSSTPQPDFNIYANLKERADNGRIQQFVFDLEIMPPASAPQLTDTEKEQLKCWLKNGAPEN